MPKTLHITPSRNYWIDFESWFRYSDPQICVNMMNPDDTTRDLLITRLTELSTTPETDDLVELTEAYNLLMSELLL